MDKIKGLNLTQTKQVAFLYWCIHTNKTINEDSPFVDLITQFQSETQTIDSFIQSMNSKSNNTTSKKKTNTLTPIQTDNSISTIRRREKKSVDAITIPNNESNETTHNNVETIDEPNENTFIVDTSKLHGEHIHMQELMDKLPKANSIEILFVDLVSINNIDYYKDDNDTYYNVKTMDISVPLFRLENKVEVSEIVEQKQMKKSRFFLKKTTA